MRFKLNKSDLIKFIEKLHLEKGDILLIKHPDMIKQLEACAGIVNFSVPIVFCPQGVQVLKRADLLNLLEQLEEKADASVLPEYSVSENVPV